MIRFDKNFKYIVFDTETESLNLRFSRPWQMAYLVCEGSKILEVHDYHLDTPNLHISKDARRVTGFDDAAHDRLKRPPREIWDKINVYLQDPSYHYVGHNILGFDVYQMKNWAESCGATVDWGYIPRCIDTLCLAKAISMNEKAPEEKDEQIFWQYKLVHTHPKTRGLSLTALGKHYAIDFDPANLHDAKEDITLNQKVFLKQIHEIDI